MPYTRLRFHIVFATHLRQRWITPDVEGFIYPVLLSEAKNLGGKILTLGGIEDHVHLLAATPPRISVSRFVQDIKCESSRAVHRKFPHLAEFAWQEEFGAFSVNPFDMNGLIRYIENQKQHHARNDLWSEYERVE